MTIDDLRGPEGLNFVRRVAGKYDRLRPPYMSYDDVEGAAALGFAQALTTFDPARGVKPTTWCGRRMVGAIRDAIRTETGGRVGSARYKAGRPAELAGYDRGDDSTGVIVADIKQADPGDIAAARELITDAPVRRRPPRDLAPDLPTPAAVAEKVTELRSAMFAAIAPTDMGDVMTAVLEKAKGGNLGAAKILIDLLAPGKSGVTVNQQAVVIQQGDIG